MATTTKPKVSNMFAQYTYTMIHRTTHRNEVVYATAGTPEIAREAVVAAYPGYAVAERPQATGTPHRIYGEIDCT